MSKRLIHVVAAVIVDEQGRILIARRHDHQHQGGLWEFPGGKVEPGEPVGCALARELDEELGIQVEQARPLIRIPHHYEDKSVLLDVWCVERFQGEAVGREGQPIRWVAPGALSEFEFPAANRPIVTAAQLPACMVITGAAKDIEEYVQRTERALSKGVRLVMLRAPEMTEVALAALYQRLKPLCDAQGATLLLNSAVAVANRLGAEGVHLTAQRLMALERRDAFEGRWISASCHTPQELLQAQQLRLDFVTLSPVQTTASHPEAEPLGWPRFAALVDECTLPVYALGGVNEVDLPAAWRHGAQGVAGISAWW